MNVAGREKQLWVALDGDALEAPLEDGADPAGLRVVAPRVGRPRGVECLAQVAGGILDEQMDVVVHETIGEQRHVPVAQMGADRLEKGRSVRVILEDELLPSSSLYDVVETGFGNCS